MQRPGTCTPSGQCADCNLAMIMKEHIKAIIQLMTLELREYNMQLLTTKCLNTAVTIMYMYFGTSALEITRFCDVTHVNEYYSKYVKDGRAASTDEIKLNSWAHLKKTLLDPSSKGRSLHYIMMTDGDMMGAADTKYFPGHVFVIEKIPKGDGKFSFNIYQSYINQYDLNGSFYIKTDKDRKPTVARSLNGMQKLCDGFDHFIKEQAWTRECIAFWKELTGVDVSEYSGYTKSNILLCARQAPVLHCAEFLKTFLIQKLDLIHRELTTNPLLLDSVYNLTPSGEPYDFGNEKALTFGQMQQEIMVALDKIHVNTRKKS